MNSELKVKSNKGIGSEFYFTLNLDVINQAHAITQLMSKNSVNISIMTADHEEKYCAINNIVYSYLEAWQCPFNKIHSLSEIDSSTDILIVCAQLFDEEACRITLDSYKNLQLVYIEGAEDKFECTHKQFHFIEQPMTGSALFDKIITLTNAKNKTVLTQNADDKLYMQKFDGNILIAEDNETNQMLISIMLQERELSFKIVNNGQEAVDEALSDTAYDIIFMDINMPILDGVSATKLLRAEGYTKPIISLSANVIESDIISFKEAGVDDSLHKPIVPEELDKVLAQYTKLKEEHIDQAYDDVNVALISKHLKIPDETIILKLLGSFISSAQSILDKLESSNINKDITHSLRGITGNFKFDLLYKMATEFEQSLKEWSKEEHTINKQILKSQLKELIKKIESLT